MRNTCKKTHRPSVATTAAATTDGKNSPWLTHGMLLAATFFWGWTFPVVKEAVAIMPVFAFLALRFGLAAALMLFFTRRLPPRNHLLFGGGLGVLLFLSFAFQTWGLVYTSSANSAFITGLNVVWVVLLGKNIKQAWPVVVLALIGLWLMTTPEVSGFNLGDALTLICSLFISLHLLMMAKLGAESSSSDMAFLQFFVVAAAAAGISAITEPSLLPPTWSGDIIFALLLTALGATIFSFWVQTHFQRRTTATRTGLIFLCEPLFAALFAAFFYGEKIPLSAALGGALIFTAMVGAVLGWRRV